MELNAGFVDGAFVLKGLKHEIRQNRAVVSCSRQIYFGYRCLNRVAVCNRVIRSAQSSIPDLMYSGGSGGDAGNFGGNDGSGGKDDEGDGEFGNNSQFAEDIVNAGVLQKMLKEAQVAIESLPKDIRYSVENGLVSESVLKRFLDLKKLPFGIGQLATQWTALRNRLVGSSAFLATVCVELSIGFGTKTAAELRARQDRFMKEIDFYLSDIALELVGDFFLVWLLSPVAKFGPPLARKGIENVVGALPSHVFQRGAFSALQRTIVLASKGSQFALVGFLASVLGHSATKALVKMRATANADVPAQHLAPVLDNSIQWGLFLGLSSNLRYQLVNGFEDRFLSSLYTVNLPAATAISTILRFGNCYVGSEHWIYWAKAVGLQ
uniref:Uncharacterized protein n=1 Tax=Timspurckia oligopyrenoides TaxID=708627 RepID=A0A7S0ZDE3_9RHOD|mmetsp:Transcript_13428/g.24082  ORF Transcript_13428/g.24082 Transcript_13428/m.24082 type:complete len:380 (+) Transcript_13428:58-1197(+)